MAEVMLPYDGTMEAQDQKFGIRRIPVGIGQNWVCRFYRGEPARA